MIRLLLYGFAFYLCAIPSVLAIDYVIIHREGEPQREISGKIEVEAEDGGVLLLGADGELWPITAEEIVSKRSDEQEFAPLTRGALGERLLQENPGFKLHTTAHYAICYNTSREYAEWVGSLYERLYDGFYNYWGKRGMKLEEPKLPLVALVFDSRENYVAHARSELGDAVGNAQGGIIGYYSLRSNQVTMYDLTGIEGLGDRRRTTSAKRITAILSQPAAERNVATIVHEATHQLVFNSGMQTRYADIPFWVSEGMAMFFETPDLQSPKGWKKIGSVNVFNLQQFYRYQRERPANSLSLLLLDDKRFRDPQTARDAYAEAWAFNYFLLRTRSEEYVAYLQELSKLQPLVALEPQQRIAMFKAAFGEDLNKIEADWLKFMRKVD